MTKRELARRLDAMIPQTPDVFRDAMQSALGDIVASAPREAAEAAKPIINKRRTLALILAAILLIAAVAVAATHWHIFDTLSFMTGASPKNADKVMQGDLYRATVNGVEITVKEAGYDGKTLFILYSYRMPDVDRCLGLFADEYKNTPEYGFDGIREDEERLLYDRGVGWWIDHLWFDGKCMNMPGNSGGNISGSATPGEIVNYEYWRLDNEGVQLSGKVDISLPIGERQPLSDYSLKDHPEKRDADGELLLPDKGIVTFTLDTADILSQVRYERPNIPVRGENVVAQATEVCYSPLMTYITLKLEGDADAIAAYKAENGEGFYAEDGTTLLWEYGGMEVFGDWVSSLELVDGDGRRMFPGHHGCNGWGNEWAEYLYPHIDEMPAELYLAHMDGDVANMEQAIKVK